MPETGRKILVKQLQSAGLTQRESEETVETIWSSIADGIVIDGKVVISGFGSFTAKQRRPRFARLPGQERKKIPARKTVHFKPSPTVLT